VQRSRFGTVLMRFPRRFLIQLGSALTAMACGGGDLVLPSDGAAGIRIVQGDDQVGAPGRPLPDLLVVRLLDQAGNPISGHQVAWVVTAGGGSVTPATGRTGDAGFASAEWTLGPDPGANTLDATADTLGVVTFSAAAGDGSEPSATRSTVSADPSTIPAETGAATITVTVRDAGGDPVPGATVALEATGAGNTLTQPSGPTGADGIATGVLSSTEPGTKQVSAIVNGSVELRETAEVIVTADRAARIALVEGDDQNAPAGASVPVRPAVRVTDEQGQPVSGVAVSFVATGGGGSVEGGDQATGADGVARVDAWTLGGSPGTNVLEARANALQGSPVVFTAEATAVAGGVDHFVFRVQPRDVDEDERFTVEVAMVDAAGNVVPRSGIEILLGLFQEGNDVPSNNHWKGDRAQDTEDGIAVFDDLRVTREGRYRIRAISDDLPELGPHGPEPFLFSDEFEVD
jgi:adhesin/invasin